MRDKENAYGYASVNFVKVPKTIDHAHSTTGDNRSHTVKNVDVMPNCQTRQHSCMQFTSYLFDLLSLEKRARQ